MINQKIHPFLLLTAVILLISACTTTTPSPSPSPEVGEPEPTHTEAIAPSPEPDDTLPPTEPAVVPEFPYSGHGDTLAMLQDADDGNHIILLLDPYGFGMREIPLPVGARPPEFFAAGFSSDGAYYAYYTGSTDTADLTLVLYDLNTESIATEIPLLSSDFPDNFQEIADDLIASGNLPEDLARYEPEEIPEQLQNAFEYGIERLAWSPDGRYLAFSGQMEGPSSDLYVLDVETMEITRLTSGTSMIFRMGWSPDGHWIRHSGTYFVAAGFRSTNYTASRDGSQITSFPTDVGIAWGSWLTNNLYLAHDDDNGPGMFNLMVMDARYGTVRTIFDGAFYAYALDPVSNTILLQSYHFFDDDPEEGLYLIQASEPYQVTQLSGPKVRSLQYIGFDEFPYLGSLLGGDTVLVRSDGSQRSLQGQNLRETPAPTINLLALSDSLLNQDNPELWIYDTDLDQRTDVYSGAVRWVGWRPDSGVLFYSTNQEMHAYSLDTGQDTLIHIWAGNPVLTLDLTWVTLP